MTLTDLWDCPRCGLTDIAITVCPHCGTQAPSVSMWPGDDPDEYLMWYQQYDNSSDAEV